ncbi:MAG: hypothetical protein K0U52_00350 [Gammaproteobacteria bacterium]|nr:hypothetical protein [Gammaproteobacteria bacterium]
MSGTNSRFNQVTLTKELINVNLTEALRTWKTITQHIVDDDDFTLSSVNVRAWTGIGLMIVLVNMQITTNGDIAPNHMYLNIDTNLPSDVIVLASNMIRMTRTDAQGNVTYVDGQVSLYNKRLTIQLTPFKSNSVYVVTGQISAEIASYAIE